MVGAAASEWSEWLEDAKNVRQQWSDGRQATALRSAVAGPLSVLASSAAANNIHEPVEMTLTGAKKSIRRRRRWSAVVLLRAARDWRHLVTWSCDVVADLNSISNATPTMTTRSERHIK